MRHLARDAGLLVGPSSGAHVLAARAWLDRYPGATVVTFCSDAGEKYLTGHFATSHVGPAARPAPAAAAV